MTLWWEYFQIILSTVLAFLHRGKVAARNGQTNEFFGVGNVSATGQLIRQDYEEYYSL
jgi:hypothetical protein